MTKLRKEELEKVRGCIAREDEEEKRLVKVIYDNKQYSIRIPKDFVESAQINYKKDKFEFTLILPSITYKDKKPKLKGRLIRG